MVAVTLLGQSFDVGPYKLGAMREAAPFIERINATAGALTTFDGAVKAACDMVGILAIGLSKVDPRFTAEAMLDAVGMGDMPDLQKAVTDILAASGLKPGEAPAPSAEAQPEGA